MTVSVVAEKLVELHRGIQGDCGHDPAAVTSQCCPLTDLPDFDSLLIPGTIRTLARTLGSPLPTGTRIKNLYVTEDGTHKRTIHEIADAFCRTYGAGSKV